MKNKIYNISWWWGAMKEVFVTNMIMMEIILDGAKHIKIAVDLIESLEMIL